MTPPLPSISNGRTAEATPTTPSALETFRRAVLALAHSTQTAPKVRSSESAAKQQFENEFSIVTKNAAGVGTDAASVATQQLPLSFYHGTPTIYTNSFTELFPTHPNVFYEMYNSVTSTNFINSSISVPASTSNTAAITAATKTDGIDVYFSNMAWSKAFVVAIFVLLILVTVVGNTLVILAVLTTRRLRTVTNCFVMNLAITDWLVGTCVMPPAVIVYVVDSWHFGRILCDIWISLDVLLCTSSILSLCAISLDRYLAVTQPLTYSKKRRSKRLALLMILVVWVTSLSITCPPYFGWYEPARRQEGYNVCRYNQNKGYVVFSAMGSFFIPLTVMLYVYLRIGYVLTSRRQRIVRDATTERTADNDIDCDNFMSESENLQSPTPKWTSFKSRWGSGRNNVTQNPNGSAQNSLKCSKCSKNFIGPGSLKHQGSFYESVEISRLSSLIQCSALSCKYPGNSNGNACSHVTPTSLSDTRASSLPIDSLHFLEKRDSFTETCLTATTSTTTTLTTKSQSVKFNQNAAQQQGQPHTHTHSQHSHRQNHRIPMRVSTTKRDSTKAAKTLTTVMGGFIACWLPFFVYYLLIPFLPPGAVLKDLITVLTWVGWVNSGINPFIYAFYNPDFRTAFWRLTCGCLCKQRPPPKHLAIFRG